MLALDDVLAFLVARLGGTLTQWDGDFTKQHLLEKTHGKGDQRLIVFIHRLALFVGQLEHRVEAVGLGELAETVQIVAGEIEQLKAALARRAHGGTG